MFVTDPYNQLATFEDTLSAFKKFDQGGFWIKKIIQHLGVFRESVMGPYSQEEAEKLAQRWKEVFRFEGEEVSKVLSFKELVCGKKNFLPICEDYLWKPPSGSSLICLIHGEYPFSIFPKKKTDTTQFKKFEIYASDQGIKKIETEDKEIYIFFNSKDVNSYRRAHIMKRYFDEKRVDGLDWVIRKIEGSETSNLEKPTLIPGYIERLDKECYPVYIDFFKEFFQIKGNKFKKVFGKLKSCTPKENKTFVYENEKEYQVIEVDLLLDDNHLRKLLFEKREDEKYNVILTVYDGSFSIGIYDISPEKSEGEMKIHFSSLQPDEQDFQYISKKLASHIMSKIDINGAILLYICKCLGVNVVFLHDNAVEKCECRGDSLTLLANHIRLLGEERSLYHALGFLREKGENVEILEKYRKMEIPIDEGDSYMTGEELAKLYLRKDCKYENICQILSQISSMMTDEGFSQDKYVLYLNELELGYFKMFF